MGLQLQTAIFTVNLSFKHRESPFTFHSDKGTYINTVNVFLQHNSIQYKWKIYHSNKGTYMVTVPRVLLPCRGGARLCDPDSYTDGG